jgi:hypothetical protein
MGRVIAFGLALAMAVGAAQAQTGSTGAPSAIPQASAVCGFLMKAGDSFETVGLGTVDVEDTAKPLSPPAASGTLRALVCMRKDLRLGQHDDRAIRELAVPLYVRDATRTAVLELDKGQFEYRVLTGNLSRAEADQVSQRLNEFQARDRTQR